MGTRRPIHDRRPRRIHRRRPHQILQRQFHQRPQLLQQIRASLPPQLRPVRLRFLPPRRSRPLHLGQLPVPRRHLHHGRFLRRLSRRQLSLQTSGHLQTLLRHVRRLRPPQFHGWPLRRQFLFSQSRRLPSQHFRSLVLRPYPFLRHPPHHRHRPLGTQRPHLSPRRSPRPQKHSSLRR